MTIVDFVIILLLFYLSDISTIFGWQHLCYSLGIDPSLMDLIGPSADWGTLSFLIEGGTKPKLNWSYLFSLDLIASASDTRMPLSLSIPTPWILKTALIPALSEAGLFGCWLDCLRCPESFQYLLSQPMLSNGWLWSFSIKGPQSQLEGHKRKGTFSLPDKNSLFIVVLFLSAWWCEFIHSELFVRIQGLLFCS